MNKNSIKKFAIESRVWLRGKIEAKLGELGISKGGIVLLDDDKKSAGIRPRWAKIYGLGPDVKDPDLQIGKYILISHGRWTRGITVETPSEQV